MLCIMQIDKCTKYIYTKHAIVIAPSIIYIWFGSNALESKIVLYDVSSAEKTSVLKHSEIIFITNRNYTRRLIIAFYDYASQHFLVYLRNLCACHCHHHFTLSHANKCIRSHIYLLRERYTNTQNAYTFN